VNAAPEVLLVAAVGAVGVLHTMVPDHWAPIALIARQQRWSRGETARAALQAGTGHVVSTLLIGLAVWVAGVAFATKFGQAVSTLSSVALIAFGGWIALSSWRELRAAGGHHHDHDHDDAERVISTKRSMRTTLLLILGSSPMIEGIPAFFAAVKYGAALLAVMAVVFAVSTIATYVVLCVSSTAGLQRLRFGKFEEYGEVLSGAFIALVGIVFLAFPVL
jgi:ABC-type nickel/cobalt efflux system permease component RcnA